MSRSSSPGFSRLQIALHWAVAFLVGSQLLFGESMTRSVDAAESGDPLSLTDKLLATSHYWFGISILALVAIRFVVRLTTGAPAPASEQPKIVHLAATATHWLFYAMLFAFPVLGLLALYAGDPWGQIHSLAKPAFLGLIVLHLGAALYHQLVVKDGTLRRMLVPVPRDNQGETAASIRMRTRRGRADGGRA